MVALSSIMLVKTIGLKLIVKRVAVYSKPSCQQCEATKRWLNSREIPFDLEDATDPLNLEAISYLGYMSAPVVVVAFEEDIPDVHWYGFNPDELNRYLEPAG